MTDSEMVERVAREVMGWSRPFGWFPDILLQSPELDVWDTGKGIRKFLPITDSNDLMMVLNRFDKWEIIKTAVYTVNIWKAPGNIAQGCHMDLAHAICEAAIKAVEE